MLRLTPRSAVELSITVVLALISLTLLLGTIDEYRAGRAFDRAMDHYAARVLEDVHDALHEAMQAKPEYAAPQEAYGKILVDEVVQCSFELTHDFPNALCLHQQ